MFRKLCSKVLTRTDYGDLYTCEDCQEEWSSLDTYLPALYTPTGCPDSPVNRAKEGRFVRAVQSFFRGFRL